MKITHGIMLLAAALAIPAGVAPIAIPALAATPATPRAQTIAYGPHALQQIDYYRAEGDFPANRPLIVFVHGGAWAGGDKSDSTGPAKIRHYTQAGYNLASVNYRLLPEAEIEDQAADIASAVSALLTNAEELGIDRHRVVLMGHSAGAHLAALVATDPHWLEAERLSPRDIAGVVLLDGAAYDVPQQIVDAGPLLGFAYQIAFGSRIGRQESLSPNHHADGENARRFLLLHVERPDSTRQARILGKTLEDHHTDARVMGFPGRGMEGHNLLNAMLGRSDSPATKPVDDWLAETFSYEG